MEKVSNDISDSKTSEYANKIALEITETLPKFASNNYEAAIEGYIRE